MYDHEHEGLHIGTLFGTTVHVQPTFLLIAGLFVVNSLRDGNETLPMALFWIPTLLFSVIAHELGHAAAFAAFGYGRSRIAITGSGGFTANNRLPRPWHDIFISLAGPFAGLMFGLVFLALLISGFRAHDEMLRFCFWRLWKANYWWMIFNLLPIYPLDGGRVLRRFSGLWISNQRSFEITTWVAFVGSGLFTLIGLGSQDYFLAMIGLSFLATNYQLWQIYKSSGFPPN